MQEIQFENKNEQGFLNSVYLVSHSTKTQITYKTALNHYKQFIDSEYSYGDLQIIEKLKTNEIDVYEFLQNFVIYLNNKKIKPMGIVTYLSGLKGYLRKSRVRINSDDFKQLVKVPKRLCQVNEALIHNFLLSSVET